MWMVCLLPGQAPGLQEPTRIYRHTQTYIHSYTYIHMHSLTYTIHTRARCYTRSIHTPIAIYVAYITYTHCYIRSIHYIHPLLYTQHTLHTPIAIHAAYIHPLLYTQHTYTHCYTHTIHYIHPLLHTQHTFICRLLCSTRLPQSYAMGCALSWLCRAVAKQASQRISYDVYID